MEPTYPRRWWALGAVAVSLLVVGLDLTVLNVALPTLATDLHASTSQLQWFANAYTLVLAALLLPAGLIGDRLGQKYVLLGALLVFGLASLACAYAGSPELLIAARVFLGIGAAFLLPMSMSLVTAMFSPQERPRALTIWVMATSLGIPLGPVLGGWLLDHFWWGSVFLINLPLVVVGAAAVIAWVPRLPGTPGGRIDVTGIALSAAGLVALTYGFIRIGDHGWTDGGSLALIVAGLGLLAGFGWWQGRTSSPLADLTLLQNRAFGWGSVLATLSSFGLMGLLFVLPQLFQAVQGADAFHTGLRLLPIIGGMLVGAKAAERVAQRSGARATVAVGYVLMAAGLGLGATSDVGDSYRWTATWMTVVGLSIGFTLPPVMGAAMDALPAGRTGSGSAMIQALRQVGGTVGVAILGTVLNGAYRDRLDVHGLPPQVAEVARGSASAGVSVGSPEVADSARHAFVHGMDLTLLTSAGVAALALVLTLAFLPAGRTGTPPEPSEPQRQTIGV
jgi:EmrB/QacA subfamily drug resistance transporter